MSDEGTARHVLARQLPEIRARVGVSSAQELADRVQKLGGKLDRAAIAKIENKTRNVTIDEVLLLALALDIAPVHLCFPRDDDEVVELAPLFMGVTAIQAREWFRGNEQLPQLDEKAYRTEVPDSEWQAARQPSQREMDAAEKVRSAQRRARVAAKVLDMLNAELKALGLEIPQMTRGFGKSPHELLRADIRTARADAAEARIDLEDARDELTYLRRKRSQAVEAIGGEDDDG